MPLRSATEDFVHTSLTAVPGLLEKLRYTADLRSAENGCGHWGLSRVYGEGVAASALAHVHSEVFASVLREPLAQLWVDTKNFCSIRRQNPRDYLGSLAERWHALLPVSAKSGMALHFKSVLSALSGLAQSLPGDSLPTS
jgi:hypothetical protein